jgi:hypothetical protein
MKSRRKSKRTAGSEYDFIIVGGGFSRQGV